MEKYICIHGHFYQPPRENPWLEAVEIQDSAYPYHDWNERITAECYATNAASRILDKNKQIRKIINNYARISFNMGPTLLSWLERMAPQVYEAIVEADNSGAINRSGHGPAMAQAYNHMIMPLANDRDLMTQVDWGIKDFHYRYKRDPEGMWLPETAVDLRSLDAMASMGIKFTLLDQHQAARILPQNSQQWKDITGGNIDPAKAYKCTLPSGRTIALFFYDGAISQAVAFEGLLKSGDEFVNRLLSGMSEHRQFPQLSHIATDGESYGHHHRFGDMALSYALDFFEDSEQATLTNYGEFLEKHPPVDEVEINENTSWSCAHGIDRWRADCGCASGGNPGWNQKWRQPLRDALDWLRDEIASPFEVEAAKYFHSPWEARDAYINVILDRSDESTAEFLHKHAKIQLNDIGATEALALMEMQRNAMLMYTSCGWFFDDISGIETVQIMSYAARALQLAAKTLGKLLVDDFLEMISEAKSNVTQHSDGSAIYRLQVLPKVVSLSKVAAHFAINSLFEQYNTETHVYCYPIESIDYQRHQAGSTELVTGHCRVTSSITRNTKEFIVGLIHISGHDFNAGVRECSDPSEYRLATDELVKTFESGAIAELVRVMDKHFGSRHFTLGDLFKDEQRKVLETLTSENTEAFVEAYRKMYQDNHLLMTFIKDIGMPVPKYFLAAAEFTLNLDLKNHLQIDVDTTRVEDILKEIEKWELDIDSVLLEFTLRRTLEKEISRLVHDPTDLSKLTKVTQMVIMAASLPFELNFWMMQNSYYTMTRTVYRSIEARAKNKTPEDIAWLESFNELGVKLQINLDAMLSGTTGDD